MLRLCLDLNIWVAALLADRKGRVNTDIEDAHVLETAIAGKADFLVTANFKYLIVDRRETTRKLRDTKKNRRDITVASRNVIQ